MAVDTYTDEHTSTDDTALDSLLHKCARVSREPASARLPRVGALIDDKYRIDALIGRGGMGAVFRATHTVSQKSVAIKWMLRGAADVHAQRRFLREVRAAGRIDHPNVIDVYDCGQDAGGCYLVMELLHGESLRRRLGRGMLPIDEAINLLLPALRGVQAVHAAGVVHRDLKPDNVFLCQSPSGEAREAKLLDFGISALQASESYPITKLTTLTAAGSIMGTPAYMSPEQLQDPRDLDARADVYAFGVILYEALTGQLPFEADSYAKLVLSIVQDQPKRPRLLRPELPAELEQIVLRALAKRREDRFASSAELMAALTPFGAAGCVAASRMRAARTRRAWQKAALAATTALSVMGTLASHSSSSQRSASDFGVRQQLSAAAIVLPLVAATSKQEPPEAGSTPSQVIVNDAPRERAGARPKSPRPAPRANTCDPPYSIDAAGHKLFKLECL